MKKVENSQAGLYVHIPFCRMKCRYCDFYSIPSTSLTTEWLRALDKEAALYTDRSTSFDTLYLGGGTPSLLTEKEFSLLVESLFRHFCTGYQPLKPSQPMKKTYAWYTDYRYQDYPDPCGEYDSHQL